MLHNSGPSPFYAHEAMRVALTASFASVALALRSAPIPRLSVPVGSNALPQPRNSGRCTCSSPRTSSLRMGADSDAAAESGGGPFTRTSLLSGVTKTAGVLGAGTFVQKGFFAGVPYFGTPDLSGKVRCGCDVSLHMVLFHELSLQQEHRW